MSRPGTIVCEIRKHRGRIWVNVSETLVVLPFIRLLVYCNVYDEATVLISFQACFCANVNCTGNWRFIGFGVAMLCDQLDQ